MDVLKSKATQDKCYQVFCHHASDSISALPAPGGSFIPPLTSNSILSATHRQGLFAAMNQFFTVSFAF